MERVENRYFDLQGLHQVNRLDISSVLWSLGVKNKTPCWESGVSKFKIFQTKQTKAKFSLRNKHWQKYRYIKWRKETQPLHSLMLFSAGSRFRISHSFTKSVFFFPLPSAIVLQMLFLRSGEKTLYRKRTAAGRCGIIVPGTDSHVVALNTKTVISSILKNVPLFNCSIIKNSCASSSQTNVSVMWENKLFFFSPLSPLTETQTHCRTFCLQLLLSAFITVIFLESHLFHWKKKTSGGKSQRKSTKHSECRPSVASF